MIYTIGYKNLSVEDLVEIVDSLDAVLIDVRSNPAFRVKRGFSKVELTASLGSAYRWMGDTLGGRTPIQNSGLDYIEQFDGSEDLHCVLMCAEHEPIECHRHHAICMPYFPQALHIYEGYLYTAHDVHWSDVPESSGSLYD